MSVVDPEPSVHTDDFASALVALLSPGKASEIWITLSKADADLVRLSGKSTLFLDTGVQSIDR
jgi:hypothetical protein